MFYIIRGIGGAKGRERSERKKKEKEFASGLCRRWGGASVETRDTSKGNEDREGCSSVELHQSESGAAA
uniref:Uncharacterized protein n=1 Tax=Solanum lycopersicum TaxID=4081 RepID=A0A3Q7FGT5_SOLLC